MKQIFFFQEEFSRSTLGYYIMSEAELRRPFDDVTSAVNASGLRFVTSRIVRVPCKLHEKWKSSDRTEEGV